MDKLKDYITPDFLTNLDVFEKCLESETLLKPYGNQLDQFILSELYLDIINIQHLYLYL